MLIMFLFPYLRIKMEHCFPLVYWYTQNGTDGLLLLIIQIRMDTDYIDKYKILIHAYQLTTYFYTQIEWT